MQKLLSFLYQGSPEWGALHADGEHIYRAVDLEEYTFISQAENINQLIAQGREGLVALAAALQQLEENGGADFPLLSLAEITMDLPLQPQRNIICVGKNYGKHIAEFDPDHARELPSHPIYFSKLPQTCIPAQADILLPDSALQEIDYEGELAVIIGEECHSIQPSQAGEYIFGYTIFNDVTSRRLQRERQQWFFGKNVETFGPLGPYILTGYHPEAFHLETYVNDELRQQATTDEMIFSVEELIADLSQVMTLLPGDIIATGTPSGVGMGYQPPRFLRPGDHVRISIHEIGTLSNSVKTKNE